MPEREKIVLTLYYYEGLTLAEIGQVLGVTESRVCQIHTKAGDPPALEAGRRRARARLAVPPVSPPATASATSAPATAGRPASPGNRSSRGAPMPSPLRRRASGAPSPSSWPSPTLLGPGRPVRPSPAPTSRPSTPRSTASARRRPWSGRATGGVDYGTEPGELVRGRRWRGHLRRPGGPRPARRRPHTPTGSARATSVPGYGRRPPRRPRAWATRWAPPAPVVHWGARVGDTYVDPLGLLDAGPPEVHLVPTELRSTGTVGGDEPGSSPA